MHSLILVLVTVSITLFGAAWIVWRLSRAVQTEGVDAGWWEHFRADKYAPLAHLLDESEFAYLASECDGDRRLVRRFRAERARIARQFLDEMKADFERLQAVGQALVLASEGGTGLQDELLRQRIRFTRAWWGVRMELWLWRLGLGGVDAQRLVDAMQASAAAVQAAFTPAA